MRGEQPQSRTPTRSHSHVNMRGLRGLAHLRALLQQGAARSLGGPPEAAWQEFQRSGMVSLASAWLGGQVGALGGCAQKTRRSATSPHLCWPLHAGSGPRSQRAARPAAAASTAATAAALAAAAAPERCGADVSSRHGSPLAGATESLPVLHDQPTLGCMLRLITGVGRLAGQCQTCQKGTSTRLLTARWTTC